MRAALVWAVAFGAYGVHAAELRLTGTIGQTFPAESAVSIPWTSCAWVAADDRGDVHFPGGFVVRRGTDEVTCEKTDVPGRVLSDGEGHLFWFREDTTELGRVRVEANALRNDGAIRKLDGGRLELHVTPVSCRNGYATRARFLGLDRTERTVRAWTADGEPLGVVFDGSSRSNAFMSVAIHPASGDLLLGTVLPEYQVHRFRPDGREVVNAVWPHRIGSAHLQNAGGDTWGLLGNAKRLGEDLSAAARREFGTFSCVVAGIARTDRGFWLATTQGAQFYPAADPTRCTRRVGGMSDVSALALHTGRVLACRGWLILNMWLDDGPGDLISSDEGWNIAKTWDERVSAIDVRNGVFYLNESRHGRVLALDPEKTRGAFGKRIREVTDVKVKADPRLVRIGERHVVRATERELELLRREGPGRYVREQALPVVATALAAEGDWLVAFVPAKHAIFRYHLENCEGTVK